MPAAAPLEDRTRRYMPPELLVKLEAARQEPGLQGERRRVTMLFCDVKGSTSAAEHLDPEDWAEVMNGAFERLIEPIYRYEGTLGRLLGDAVLAFFGAPIGHEDDPERAVLAGLEVVEALGDYRAAVREQWGIEIDVRAGINTGLVVVGGVGSDLRMDYTAMGDAVNIAARMEQTAAPGTVQISGETYRYVRPLFEFEDLGEVEVKGHAEPVHTYRPLRAVERPETLRGIEGLRASLVGRDEEVAQLRAVMAEVREGRGRIVSVVGEAGLGKSRLLSELRASSTTDESFDTLQWYEGRTLSYETQTPYAAVQRLVRQVVGAAPEDSPGETWERVSSVTADLLPGQVAAVAPFISTLLGGTVPSEHVDRVKYLEPGALRDATVSSVLALIEARAKSHPTVVVFEDLHWADSASLDVAGALQRVVTTSALVLILILRPNREDPAWEVHRAAEHDHPHVVTNIRLHPLSTEATRQLIAELLDIDGLTDEVRDLILQRAEGNPFFVEEVTRSLIDQGIVARQEDRWIAVRPVATTEVPDSLRSLLTARLDRLPDHARTVVHAASVVGREFYYDEVAAGVGDLAPLDDALVELQRRELIREVATMPRRQYRFQHVLVQEAAYETVLLRRRTELHAALADVLEVRQPERVEDLARHLLAARQPGRAIPYLVTSGERAARAYATADAVQQLERALELMGPDPEEPELLRRALESLGRAHESRFQLAEARATYERLLSEGERLDDMPMRISALNKLSFLRGLFMGERDEALADLARAEELARSTGYDVGLVESCTVQCYLHTGHAEFDEVEQYMAEVVRLGDDLEMDDAVLFGMTHHTNTLVYLTRFDEALERGLRAVSTAERAGDLRYQAELLTFAIPLCYMRNGDMPSAMQALERGMEIAERIGHREAECLASMFQGKMAMAAADYETALAAFRRTVEASDATGLPYLRAMGRCVTGTCYQQIAGPDFPMTTQFHDAAIDLMQMPTGHILGALLWSELGNCALALGELEKANSLFDRALNEVSAPMYVMRPLPLQGKCAVALAEGDTAEARRWWEELEQYVSERGMADQQPAVLLTRAQLEAAEGNTGEALATADGLLEAIAGAGMRRLELDLHLCRARWLQALDRPDQASGALESARGLVDDIAGSFRDDKLRRAFRNSVAPSLERV